MSAAIACSSSCDPIGIVVLGLMPNLESEPALTSQMIVVSCAVRPCVPAYHQAQRSATLSGIPSGLFNFPPEVLTAKQKD